MTLILLIRRLKHSCSNIPERLYRNGRAEDNNFRKFHFVYFRIEKEEIDILKGRLIPGRIKYFNKSVNWSKYSKPADVIIGYPNWGIARLWTCRLPVCFPKELSHQSENIYKFLLRHDPLEDNYSHCEIAVFKEDGRLQKNSISNTAKKEFRTMMSDCSIIILKPSKKN